MKSVDALIESTPPAPAESFLPDYEMGKWETDFLVTQEVLRSEFFGIHAKAKTVRYPVRMLRYWFGYHLLAAEYRRRGRPIEIAELGTHNGQMFVFAKLAASRVKDPRQVLRWSRWLGVDAVLKHEILAIAGYDELQEANLEDADFKLEEPCDTALCLHILEHSNDPAEMLRKIAAGVRSDGSIIGASPVLPHFLVKTRERQLRETARHFGHVSAFSPTRIEQLVTDAGLRLEFISGAFFMRHKGFVLENSRTWLKLNLWWGRNFPWWPGEVHWVARKP